MRLSYLAQYAVEGHFFSRIFKLLVQRIDRLIACVAKWLLFITSRVDRRKIMFHSFQAEYTCNGKYITEKLLELYPGYDIVWAARKPALKNPQAFPPGVRTVCIHSFAYYRELYTSKVLVHNSSALLMRPIFLRKSQVLIQTWHGSLGIKRIGLEDYRGRDRRMWKKRTAKHCARTNFVITNSVFEETLFRDSLWPETAMWTIGHPRNDVLFERNDGKTAAVRGRICREYGIPEDSKIVLYAPTFRDDHRYDAYNIDTDAFLAALSERFGGRWTFMIRFHTLLRKQMISSRSTKRLIDATDYPDIQELMLAADVAVTDYSSWIYDFMLTRRPGFLFTVDIEKYNNERGFYYPLETTPFPIARDNAQLIENVQRFDSSAYAKRLEAFLDEKGCYEDGRASERAARLIHGILEGAAAGSDTAEADIR